jgi:methyl-accepting chemotaxis protein
MFGQMSLSKKLTFGFGAVMILAAIIGGVSIFSLNESNSSFLRYRQIARNTNLTGRIQANMLTVRMNAKTFLISSDMDQVKQLEENIGKTDEFVKQAKERIKNEERAKRIAKIEQDVDEYRDVFSKVTMLVQQRNQFLNEVLNVEGPKIEKDLTEIMTSAERDKDVIASFRSGMAVRNLLLARLYVMKFLDSNKPEDKNRVDQELGELEKTFALLDQELQNQGRRKLFNEARDKENVYKETFAKLAAAIENRNNFVQGTLDRIGPQIADLTEETKLEYMAEQDDLGPKAVAANNRSMILTIIIGVAALIIGALLAFFITRGITSALQNIINQLRSGAEQVSSASEQLASSSQSMSEGASEQASSLEEVSSSLEEMSSMTKQNAENSKQSKLMADDTRTSAQQGKDAMERMNSAIISIKTSADETAKIIKTIDEIAMQTNLLALNAAVEAARAGDAGRGFAVVAEEVRNLAQRSADAAKNTANLIEGSQKNAENGVTVSQEVNTTLGDIVNKVDKVSQLISEVSAASSEQSQGIDQVNTAVAQMDKVTQSNAANAEESASASEELSSQAQQLNAMVIELVSVVEGKKMNGSTTMQSTHQSKGASHIAHSFIHKNHTPLSSLDRRTTKQVAGSAFTHAKEIQPHEMIPFDDDKDLKEF